MATPTRLAALDLSNHQGSTWTGNIRGGVLAQLSPNDPQIKVGTTDYFTFTGTPAAELVGESAPKSSQDPGITKVTAKTYKVQVTYRFSNEVQWSDEDYQTGLVDGMVANIATALSRALDLIAIHGINPATGAAAPSVVEYFTRTGNGVERVAPTADANADLMAMAAAIQSNGHIATGIAFDPVFAGELARSRDGDNRPLFPELGLGFGFDNFQGLQAAASDTVSGRRELAAADVDVSALMGDFNAFAWGVAREVPLELIEFGDPDGNGDLKRTNEVAIRAESVFGYAIFDPTAFALRESA